ncbi:hypothetical protein [Pseudodesulfovibrio sp.]|uniref:hypothetical protein n=1 Tax=Pseudodesulfovibrio sp. TaxID=2035812 RepID=UPI002638E7FE|nr:hypothetical protein [Pseudodesulfovibrio sp.]MDD3313074.1 hypothetical protein [Pseudodesulfovibrio sp.]
MQNITAWGSLKQSVALMWNRKLAVLGFVVVQAVLYAAYAALGLGDPENVRGSLDAVGIMPVLLGVPFFALVGMVVYLFYSHYMVTALRGGPVLVPVRPVVAFLRFLWACIKLGAAGAVLAGLVFAVPAGLALGVPALRESTAAIIAVVLYGFAAMLWLLLVTLRLELVLPGVAAGDGTTLREAWRISRGSGWRLFRSVLLLLILIVAVVLAVGLPLILTLGAEALIVVTCMALLNALAGLMGTTLLCVWYVRLSDGPAGEDQMPRVENLAGKIREGYYAGGPEA